MAGNGSIEVEAAWRQACKEVFATPLSEIRGDLYEAVKRRAEELASDEHDWYQIALAERKRAKDAEELSERRRKEMHRLLDESNAARASLREYVEFFSGAYVNSDTQFRAMRSRALDTLQQRRMAVFA